MKKNLLLFMLLTALFSCTEKANDVEEVKTLKVLDAPNEGFDFESVKLIPLQTGEDFYLGDEIRFKNADHEFYIADRETQRTVYRFDENGRFLNKIGKSGNGPNEYAGFRDFIVYNDTIDLLTGKGGTTTIFGYRKDGTFLYQKNIDLIALQFDKSESNYILYTSYNKAFHQSRIYLANTDGVIIDSLLKDNTQLNMPVEDYNFSHTTKDVYFKETFNNTLYKFEKDSLKITYVLDYGKYNIPESFYEEEMIPGFEMINKNGFANVRLYHENKNFATFWIVLQKEDISLLHYHVLYNKASNKLQSSKYDYQNMENVLFEYAAALTENDELVYLIQPYKIENNKEQLTKLPLSNPEVLNEVNEQDNPVIAICKLKRN